MKRRVPKRSPNVFVTSFSASARSPLLVVRLYRLEREVCGRFANPLPGTRNLARSTHVAATKPLLSQALAVEAVTGEPVSVQGEIQGTGRNTGRDRDVTDPIRTRFDKNGA